MSGRSAAEICAATARVGELGGSVMMAGIDSPAGRLSVVTDPQGATFAVIALALDLPLAAPRHDPERPATIY